MARGVEVSEQQQEIHWELGRGFEPQLGNVGQWQELCGKGKLSSGAWSVCEHHEVHGGGLAGQGHVQSKSETHRVWPLLLGAWASSISTGFPGRAQRALAGSTASSSVKFRV
jgi:hypothetical protein